jgi:hypothetical protein
MESLMECFMNLTGKRIILLILSYCFFSITNAKATTRDEKYVAGQIMLTVPDSYVELPLEIYGAYISFNESDTSIKIDKVLYLTFKPNSRRIEKEEPINYDSLLIKYSSIAGKVKFNFSKGILKLFKKYHVTLVRRIIKTFSPADTLLHPVQTRLGEKLVKSRNYNNLLAIEFSKQFDAKDVAEDFKKLKDISKALPDYYITPY